MASLRRIRTLIASWVAYWVVLAGVTLGPAAVAIWRATHAAKGKSDFALAFADGRFTLTVHELGRTTYTGSASLLALAVWIAGPPLVSWAFWMARRPKPERASAGKP